MCFTLQSIKGWKVTLTVTYIFVMLTKNLLFPVCWVFEVDRSLDSTPAATLVRCTIDVPTKMVTCTELSEEK